MKKTFLITYCLLLAALVSGCGYTTRSTISAQFKTIYIEPFINKIDITKETDIESKYKVYQPLLETDITRAVSNKYLFDGNLRPSTKEGADLVLKGEVMEFKRDPLRYTDENEVEEYRISISINLKLYDNKKEELLWEENYFTGIANYYTSFYPVASEQTSEASAVDNAISDLARRIVERTVEVW